MSNSIKAPFYSVAPLFSAVTLSFSLPLIVFSFPAKAQTNQSFSQCVLNLYSGPYSANDAAKNCLTAFRGRAVNEEFTTCVIALYKGPFSQSDANQYCQRALESSASTTPDSEDIRERRRRGGDPQAIQQCMNGLLYVRKPVCTRSACARLSTPEENANNGFGGWQWQTVRTETSESTAADACRNAR